MEVRREEYPTLDGRRGPRSAQAGPFHTCARARLSLLGLVTSQRVERTFSTHHSSTGHSWRWGGPHRDTDHFFLS